MQEESVTYSSVVELDCPPGIIPCHSWKHTHTHTHINTVACRLQALNATQWMCVTICGVQIVQEKKKKKTTKKQNKTKKQLIIIHVLVFPCVHSRRIHVNTAGLCLCYLWVAREAGPYDPRQELAVDGSGRDDLSRGHGGDALQSFLLGILVLRKANTHKTKQETHTVSVIMMDTLHITHTERPAAPWQAGQSWKWVFESWVMESELLQTIRDQGGKNS